MKGQIVLWVGRKSFCYHLCNWLVILKQEHIVFGKGERVLTMKLQVWIWGGGLSSWLLLLWWVKLWVPGSAEQHGAAWEQHEITLSQGRSLPPRHVVIVIPIITLQLFLHLTVIQYTSKNCPSCWKFFLLMFHPVSTLQDNAKQTT